MLSLKSKSLGQKNANSGHVWKKKCNLDQIGGNQWKYNNYYLLFIDVLLLVQLLKKLEIIFAVSCFYFHRLKKNLSDFWNFISKPRYSYFVIRGVSSVIDFQIKSSFSTEKETHMVESNTNLYKFAKKFKVLLLAEIGALQSSSYWQMTLLLQIGMWLLTVYNLRNFYVPLRSNAHIIVWKEEI